MQGWLKTAGGLFRRKQGESGPAFEIRCDCGRNLTSPRTVSLQTILCPDCRVSHFVLPASVYPRPKSARPKARENAQRPGRLPEAEQGQQRKPEGVPAGSQDPVRSTTRARPRAAALAAEHPASGPPVAQVPSVQIDFDRLRRKLFSPVRMVLAGIGAVIGLTAWWIVEQHGRALADRTIVTAARDAELALREHDLGEAARQYHALRLALDRLGRRDLQARRLRQAADEVTAAADLSRSSLFDLLHEAAAMAASTARGSWTATFRSSYRDEWIVVDAQVRRVSAAGSGRQYEIDFPLVDGSQRARLVGNLAAFDRLPAADGTPQRVIFAAQLEACDPDPGAEDSWNIVLRPATGFLWSTAAHLELMGLAADDETQRLLVNQTAWLGNSP